MGSLYRSESMALCQLFLQVDSAFESVAQLGELGICQFRDLNSGISPFQRKYVSEVKRCNEMERKIRFLEEEMNRQCVPIPDLRECPPAPPPKDINDLEVNLERLEDEVLKMNTSVEEMRRDYARLSDMQAVLLQLQVFFQEDQRSNAINAIADAGVGPIEVHSPMAGANNAAGFVGSKTRADSMMPIVPRSNELRFLAGIVPTASGLAFERLLWRMCHGKVFFRTQNVRPDPLAPFIDEQKKSAFILFFAGDSFLPKVKRICDSFRATIVDNCPEDAFERAKVLNSVLMRISDMNTVIGKTLEHRQKMLTGAALKLREWDIQVLKLKSIFFELNKFSLDVTQRCLIAECWVPQFGVAQVRRALHAAAEANGSSVPSIVNRLEGDEFHGHGTPPTFHRLNKFTSAFQGIVDAYGVANYREVNPAPWTIITFPFLFALMFGDSGHGLVMLLAALGLILFERRIEAAKIRDEIFNTFYGGRYVIMLMGAFAIYTGLIYNDVFSKSLNLFGSRWRNDFNVSALMIHMEIDEEKALELDPYGAFLHDQGPYIFGLDPVWNLAENRLNFVNPMKMKASVIIGVSQMLFGLLLSLQNHRFFRSKLDTFFVFLPQLLFLSLIFIYLCAQIIAKWLFFWVKSGVVLGQSYPGAQCAPSLLVGLINMFMFKGRQQGFVDAEGKTLAQCHLQYWYPKQGQVETTFMTIAMLCIPVMLLVKPLVLLVRSKKGLHVEVHGAEDGVFRFGDVFVYQAIHTIEFALGCISHTASYLRLWALSLAHAQLSEVLWTMVMRFGFTLAGWPGAVASFTIFWAFGILSFAILVLMEGLSAFLHALRLHWVEFQSKFYVGAGIAFEPFSFVKAIRKHEGLDD